MTQAPLLTKAQIMQRVAEGLALECHENSKHGWFNITGMRSQALLERREPVLVELEQGGLLEWLRTQCVHDKARVAEFMAKMSFNPMEQDPAIIIHWPEDDGYLMVDGVHRVLAAHALGMKHYPYWLFDHSEILRPPPGYGMNPEYEWGDDLVDGQIVKRT